MPQMMPIYWFIIFLFVLSSFFVLLMFLSEFYYFIQLKNQNKDVYSFSSFLLKSKFL